MSEQYRNEHGRFAKKKKVEKIKKCINAMSKAKKKAIIGKPVEGSLTMCEGKRIVDVPVLARNLKCTNCKSLLDLEKMSEEKRSGLSSVFIVACDKCKTSNSVCTSKVQTINNKTYEDNNSGIILGAIHSGAGHTALSKILACANIPNVSLKLYKRYEEHVGSGIEQAAKESCKRATLQERQLVMDNIEKINDLLPADVVNDIYPNLEILRSSHDETISNDVHQSSIPFDTALGKIVNIIISYDMGWTKRGTGRSYDSLNGYGTIIGFLSGKILDYRTRNRKCNKCDIGQSKNDHVCRKNFKGSAKAMEADAGADLINNSIILKEAGLQVRVVIGDEDSSTIAAVRKDNVQTIYKLADHNHLVKNFGKELYNLAKSSRELNKKGAILHIKKCFAYAIKQNKGKSADLAQTIRSIPDHIFDRHENCGVWCKRTQNSDSQTVKLKDEALFSKLKTLLHKYANNACKFSTAASSQANESLNNIIAHKMHKNVCLSRSAAVDFRVASAVCTKNDGERSIEDIKNKLCLSPGTHTLKYASRYDYKRAQRANKMKTKAHKSRRIELAKNREKLRQKNERSEGVMYKSNSGIDAKGINIIQHESGSSEAISEKVACNVIYFDLETSGLSKSDNILQIAAKCENRQFNVYITPTQSISFGATQITGLHSIAGDLYLKDKRVESLCLKDALIAFLQFLELYKNSNMILVAHNARFDVPRLLRAIIDCDMQASFRVISGFSDTLSVFRQAFPDRKGPGMFKLSKLALDLLGIDDSENFHEATFDVEILQNLINNIQKEGELSRKMKTYELSLSEEVQCEMLKKNLDQLALLKTVISRDLLKKIAKENITYNTLKESFTNGGDEAVLQLLSNKLENGKPRVTKNKKVLAKIITSLKEN